MAASRQMGRITNPSAVPYRWVCSILVEWNTATRREILPITQETTGRWTGGTGLLIARRYVLTCGHILRTTFRAKPKRILVVPARKPAKNLPNGAPFGVWEGDASWVHSNLFDARLGMAQSYDFGLIKLAPNDENRLLGDFRMPSGALFGWWGKERHNSLKAFGTSFDQGLSRRRVNVAGFPGKSGDKLYHGFNDVLETFPRDSELRRIKPLVVYDVATAKGVSGGPIWTFDKNPVRRRLVAVHSGHSVKRGRVQNGIGLLLRPPLIRFLLAKGVPRKELRLSGWKP